MFCKVFGFLIVLIGIALVPLAIGQAGQSPCSSSTRYVCSDTFDTNSVCLVIFPGSNPSNGSIDPKCSNPTYSSTAAQCAHTCAACCQTAAYNCQNAPSPNPFNCAALTTLQCKTPSSQTQLAKYCPATCGLCTVGSCTDLINCTGMSGACFVSSTQTFMCQQCAKTCGCPTTCSSTSTPSGTPTSTCGTDNASCATWKNNGFCTSTFYTAAQKKQYCPITCGLCSG